MEMQRNDANSEDSQPWATLTSLTPQLDNINLTKDSYTLGKNSTNDIQIEDTRLSNIHCKIYKDEDDTVWIEDLSLDGTFIENKIIGKGKKEKLESGDNIYLLHQSEEIVGYTFEMEDAQTRLSRQIMHQLQLEDEERRRQEQEDLGQEMKCEICVDYIYKCVTLIPCLHNFCGACLTAWMKKSTTCPQCQEEILQERKNLPIDNMIKKFMENNPSKKRSQEEYDHMDKIDEFSNNLIK